MYPRQKVKYVTFAHISWAKTSHTIPPTRMGKWKIGEAYG